MNSILYFFLSWTVVYKTPKDIAKTQEIPTMIYR